MRLEPVDRNILKIGEDGTPMLDIKPYASDLDTRRAVKKGWYEHAGNRIEYERNKGIP
jgi:tRNA (Thr-GGU) A37 N-methylase